MEETLDLPKAGRLGLARNAGSDSGGFRDLMQSVLVLAVVVRVGTLEAYRPLKSERDRNLDGGC